MNRDYEADLNGYTDLPIGTQLELEIMCSQCDCGGWKTYGSMAPEFHSTSLPCSSLKDKNATRQNDPRD